MPNKSHPTDPAPLRLSRDMHFLFDIFVNAFRNGATLGKTNLLNFAADNLSMEVIEDKGALTLIIKRLETAGFIEIDPFTGGIKLDSKAVSG